MAYGEQAIAQMREAFGTVDERYQAMREAFIMREYRTARGKEFALHGFCRRLSILALTTRHVFELLPPDLDGVPKKELLDDVTIQVQAFMINAFGAMDNLAWTWCFERGLKRDNGKEIPASWVSLSPKNTFLVPTLSDDFQARLAELKEWFSIIEGYRHGLAHRIPLYIPPFAVLESKVAEYAELETKVFEALSRRSLDEMEKHQADQRALQVFHPRIMHSFEERARTIDFHPQMLTDFGLAEDLGRRMLEELDSLEQ
ncbi:hypothetical protein [Devosia nitrariae]|uniref:Uncharacterized protein n=1 Tax=Devosia nitrariae TaxID=2071872 RepID=A0ABQ5W0X4_9HYPH|nr:hypothetical protein [Devosia nitrariae]GLQ53565.1 hypothetical protein GCM10010862_08240 [Devosia nitrariae]